MHSYIPLDLIRLRIRWRLVMIVLHTIMVVFSFALAVAMVLPTIINPASTQYILVEIMLFMMAFYSIFGLVVYCRCRFLLRVLGIASAIILGVVTFQFIMSYISSLACRYDEEMTRIRDFGKLNCSGEDSHTLTNRNLQCRYPKSQVTMYIVTKQNCSSIDFRRLNLECYRKTREETTTDNPVQKMMKSNGEIHHAENNQSLPEQNKNGSSPLVQTLDDTQTKWESDPISNEVACYTQDPESSSMICRKFQPTFSYVYFDPDNCTNEFQQDKEYECRHDEDSGWVPAKSPEDICQFPDNVSQYFNCQIQFTNLTHCPPLANFWKMIGDNAVATRKAILPLGAVYALLALFVLIMTLWHTVDEVRFGQCLCASCEAGHEPSVMLAQDSGPTYIMTVQPVTSPTGNTREGHQPPTQTINSIRDLAQNSFLDDNGISNCNSRAVGDGTQRQSWIESHEHNLNVSWPSELRTSSCVSQSTKQSQQENARDRVKECFPTSFLTEPFSWSYCSKLPAVQLLKSRPIDYDDVLL